MESEKERAGILKSPAKSFIRSTSIEEDGSFSRSMSRSVSVDENLKDNTAIEIEENNNEAQLVEDEDSDKVMQ